MTNEDKTDKTKQKYKKGRSRWSGLGVSFHEQGLGVTMVTWQRDDVITSQRMLGTVGIFAGVTKSHCSTLGKEKGLEIISLLKSVHGIFLFYYD